MTEKKVEENDEKGQYELLSLSDKMLEEEEFDKVFKNYPLTDDTTCGYGFIQGKCLQM